MIVLVKLSWYYAESYHLKDLTIDCTEYIWRVPEIVATEFDVNVHTLFVT